MNTRAKKTVVVGLKIWAAFSTRATEGILSYAQRHPHYEFRDIIWAEAEQLPDQLARARPDGAILSLTAMEYAKIRDLIPADLPLVSIGADTIATNVGTVCSDDRAMVSLAVKHLRAAGYRRIAFVGWEGSPGTARRIAIFKTLCRGAEIFNVTLQGPIEDLDAATKRELKAWLRELRPPVGIVAWSGHIAQHVRRKAELLGLKVPGDLGMVSLADDRPCLLGEPTISALDVNGAQLGHQAMAMLAAIMRGEVPPNQPSMVMPTGVIARGSTAMAAQSNDTIDEALRYIEENAMRGIVVKNVLATLPGVGRTRFYAEFTDRIGCSPADYIRQLKITRAKELLRTTELTVTRIAAMCGFASTTQFGDTFKREVGLTPMAFRTTTGVYRR